jgi:hypothetical protein
VRSSSTCSFCLGLAEFCIAPSPFWRDASSSFLSFFLPGARFPASGAKKVINSELWHACAGPLVCLPQRGSLVYYFPQGHSEQVSSNGF